MTSDNNEFEEEDLILEIPLKSEEPIPSETMWDPFVSPPKEHTAPVKTTPQTQSSWLDLLLILCIIVLSLSSVFVTLRGIGFSWDEAYYYQPAHDAMVWVGELLQAPVEAFRQDTIDLYWTGLSELPAVSKFLLGWSATLFSSLFGHYHGMRMITIMAFSLSLVLVYLIGFQAGGRFVALSSTLLYWLMPRVFGHAHIAATETFAVFFTLLTVWLFLKSMTTEKRWWAVLTAVAAGLALATRINCILMFPVLIVVGYLFWSRKCVHTLFFLIVVSPVVMILVSPYFWHNTVLRILEYLAFFATHKQNSLLYMGVRYLPGGIHVPWHYPWVMTAITLPILTLFLLLVGIVSSVQHVKDGKVALILAMAFFPLLISSLPGVPVYDGVRLFLTAFPFLALIAGLGLRWFVNGITTWVRTQKESRKKVSRTMALVILILVTLNGTISLVKYHPYYLSFFNSLVGGVKGAYGAGFETTYWGEVVNKEMLDYMNVTLPEGAKLKLLALHEKVFQYFQEWGMLRNDIVIDAPPPYDYHLLLIRRGFFARPESYLFEHYTPTKVVSLHSVPLLALYKTGPEFEKEWPARAPVTH